ncbi:MAG: hypothetical protein PVF73_08630 [Bacteroidales bacterium]|jgi:hypothetical protein
MTNSKPRYDVKKGLEKYMPSLMKFMEGHDIPWIKISRSLESHIDKIRDKVNSCNNKGPTEDTTFYSFIVGMAVGKKETAAMFDFFNSTFESLQQRLNNDESRHIHRMIKKVLTNFDYKYLNFIGEIATINAYKSTGKYSLINIEEKAYQQNNVSIDLFLQRKKDERKFLVEVVNIHLKDKQIKHKKELEYHINSKIKDKIDEKVFDNPKYEVYIQPVIWVKDLEQLKLLYKIFKREKRVINNVYIPLTYLTLLLPDNTFEHRFEYANTILKGEKKVGLQNCFKKRNHEQLQNTTIPN